MFVQNVHLFSLTENKLSNSEVATITTDKALKGSKVLTMSKEEERKGYCTTKGKDSDKEIERQSYKSDVVIAIENRDTIGDELLVRSSVSTFTMNCICKSENCH